MTFELTPERLQEIAVGCVTKFVQKQASLSEAIAKEAMDLELNSDQTKRVIEASNTIAYLRQLEKSADRTFEFDVADYTKVMAHMCMPEDMFKAAEDDSDDEDDKEHDGDGKGRKEGEKEEDKSEDKEDADLVAKKDEKSNAADSGNPGSDNDKKDDSDKDDSDDSSDQEKRAFLMKGYFGAKEVLEKMACEGIGICIELSEAAGRMGKDPRGLEKLAFIVDAKDLDKTLKLCNIEKRAQEDAIFTNKDLVAANHLYGLYKKANEFVAKENELANFVKRAEQLLFKQPADVEKQAGLGSMIGSGLGYAVRGVGRAIGTVAGYGAAKLGSGLKGAATGGINFSRAAASAGKTTDEAIKDFDSVKSMQGVEAAKAKYQGNKPSLLTQRIGITGATTALAGLSMDHKNNVRDI